jgi:hypothetical protein
MVMMVMVVVVMVTMVSSGRRLVFCSAEKMILEKPWLWQR